MGRERTWSDTPEQRRFHHHRLRRRPGASDVFAARLLPTLYVSGPPLEDHLQANINIQHQVNKFFIVATVPVAEPRFKMEERNQ